jgi:hypothetical protein
MTVILSFSLPPIITWASLEPFFTRFTLNVNGFYCYISWFNCIDNFNNEFHIIIKNIDNEVIQTYVYKLNDGNPNVNDVKSNLNNLLLNTLPDTQQESLSLHSLIVEIETLACGRHAWYLRNSSVLTSFQVCNF